jgi:type IV pilus assembly protein PilQ
MRNAMADSFFSILTRSVLVPMLVLAAAPALAQDGEGSASVIEARAEAPARRGSRARIRRLSVRGGDARADILIRGSLGIPEYSILSRDSGRIVVIDVENATMPEAGLPMNGHSGLVVSASTAATARGVRIELALSAPVAYRARATSGRIEIRLEPLPDGEDDEIPVARSAASRAETATVAEAGEHITVEGVAVERRDDRDRVIVRLSHTAEFRLLPGSEGPARLEISDAAIGADAATELDLPDEEGRLVHAVRVVAEADRTVIEVDRARGATGTAIREGDRIVWLFAAGIPDEEVSGRPRSRTIAREDDPTEGIDEIITADELVAAGVGLAEEFDEEITGDEAAAFLTDIPLQVDEARGRRRYRGRRIDLDFNNADIHNILRLLAEVGGVNIVTSDDVSGAVTIRMRNVPWDQALEVILQAKGLGMVRRGNLIRVAPLETLEKERELAIARRKQLEELEPLETRLVPVSYATAGDLEPRVEELISERGSVSVDERTNVLIVRDIAENLDDVEELVRTLDTQTPQVLVEARIVEATSQYVRDVGIQWGGDVTMNTATGNPTGLIFPANLGVIGGNYDPASPTAGLSPFTRTVTTPNYAVNLPATTGTGAGGALGITLGSLGGTVNVAVRLSAAEANGVVRIISSPRILTLDNHEAHISQGTLIPYSQVSAQGVQTAFQEAELELRVRPHVTSDGSVSMHVKLTRDEPDFTRTSARGDPTILKREAETDLLIEDGHTAVIGGIYTRNTGRTVDSVPFFGDIPILGVLFQRRRVRDERNELLIFLTPRIVNRAEALVE